MSSNIFFQGDMSFVGPRALMPEVIEVESFGEVMPIYVRRQRRPNTSRETSRASRVRYQPSGLYAGKT